jgi:hypothetical protein
MNISETKSHSVAAFQVLLYNTDRKAMEGVSGLDTKDSHCSFFVQSKN